MRSPYKIVFGIPARKSPLRNGRDRWVDNINK
jgi:hypothetical protein